MALTTSWTIVFKAARDDCQSDNQALGALMERYWQPLYFFARRQGLSAADAEDATQSFLLHLMQSDSLAAADPAKGRFRTYLLTLWKRFLMDRARFDNRKKRGGGLSITSLNYNEGEQAWLNWSNVASPDSDPDRAFCQQWATTLIDAALAQVRQEYAQSRRAHLCESLMPFLTVPIQSETYRQIAARLGGSEGAAKVALHRLRQRFALAVRQQILATLDDPSDVEVELGELVRYSKYLNQKI